MDYKIDLSGTYEFRMESASLGEIIYDSSMLFHDQISLPTTASEAQKGERKEGGPSDHLTDPYAFEGCAWFKKTICLPKADAYTLCLERTRISHVWLNGKPLGIQNSLVGKHIYDATKAAQEGENELVLMVQNVGYPIPGGHMTSPDTQTNWNGIVGEISMTCHQKLRIDSLRTFCEPSEDNRFLPKPVAGFELQITNLTDKNLEETISISSSLLTLIWERDNHADFELNCIRNIENPLLQSVSLVPGCNFVKLYYDLTSSNCLWSEHSPQVYEFAVSIGEENTTTYFGLKVFTHDGEHFYINGQKTFLRGKHDGMSFPLTGYAPMDLESWAQVFATAKDYGINHYRYHTCCPPDVAFFAADLVGIYMQPELSFWGTVRNPSEPEYDEAAQTFLHDEGVRILHDFGNHPSFVMMSMGNELWGDADVLNSLLGEYKTLRPNVLFAQGSNNFFWTPKLLSNDDFFSGVRFSIDRQIRGSFAACDVPYGHVQMDTPATRFNYDESIRPGESTTTATAVLEDGFAEIQYGTGVKKVKLDQIDGELISDVPVISHEVGQYSFFPDFKEINQYTGVLQPENLKIFQKNMQDAGLSSMSDAFFYSAGKLAVDCYKDEIETMFRSAHMAGFQLLDLTDFMGQGSAMVGILNSMYQNKGLISAKAWRGFCSDTVIMAEFDSYIVQDEDSFQFDVSMHYTGAEPIPSATLVMTLAETWGACSGTTTSCSDCESKAEGKPCGDIASFTRAKLVHINERGYQKIASAKFDIPKKERPTAYTLTVSISGTEISNSYTLWSYPKEMKIAKNCPLVATTLENAKTLSKEHKKILLFLSDEENTESIEGFYTSDFWNYPMFKSICDSVGKPAAPGTLGLYINDRHPALAGFPSRSYSTPQWFHLVMNSRSSILDHTDIEPIVWTIDNTTRCHKLGLLYEIPGVSEDSHILICTANVPKLLEQGHPEVEAFYQSLLAYCEEEF